MLSEAYKARIPALQAIVPELKRRVRSALEMVGHDHLDHVSFRVKDVVSFTSKALDYPSPLKEVEDQVGGRVVVLFEHDVPDALELLRRTFNEVEQKHLRPDAIAEFGYEGEHLICVIPKDAHPVGWERDPTLPDVFELQVKTVFQHAWAAAGHDLGYKPTEPLSPSQMRALHWIAASAWGADHQFERLWREANDRTVQST